MKKFIFLMSLVLTIAVIVPTFICEAKDIWVDHWNTENVDIYVMDDTLRNGSTDTGKYFKVSTKEVRDGNLVRVVDWSFSKYKTDMWRYSTSTMNSYHRGHPSRSDLRVLYEYTWMGLSHQERLVLLMNLSNNKSTVRNGGAFA